jgi:TolB-like protein
MLLPVGKSTSSNPSTKNAPARKKPLAWAAILLALIIVLFSVYYVVGVKGEGAGQDATVAVLAFTDLSPGKDQDWFSDGLSAEIINSLAKLRELKVVARTSSFYFKDKDLPLSEIADQLKVGHVVHGSVQKIGDRLRISAQLIRTSDGLQLWSEQYNRDYADLFRVETEIAHNIASKLVSELTPEKKDRLSTSKPASLEAYENYLKGYAAHHTRYWNSRSIADYNESEKYFLKAISLEPTYADAYGALADLYDTRSFSPFNDANARARDSVARIGHRLNPNSLQVLQIYGYIFRKTIRPNLDSSFYYFKKALDVAPDDPQVVRNMSFFYKSIGLLDHGMRLDSIALRLDPISPRFLEEHARWYIGKESYTKAREFFSKIMALDSNHLTVHYWMGLIACFERKPDLARKELQILHRIGGEESFEIEERLQAFIFAVEGKKAEALKSRQLDLRLFCMLGMKKEFLSHADSLAHLSVPAIYHNPIYFPTYLRKNSLFDFVRDEAAFKDLLERVSRRHDQYVSRYGSGTL